RMLRRNGLARFWLRLTPAEPAARKTMTASLLLAGRTGLDDQLVATFHEPLVLPTQSSALAWQHSNGAMEMRAQNRRLAIREFTFSSFEVAQKQPGTPRAPARTVLGRK